MAEYIDKQAAIADLNETYDKMAGFHPQFYNGYQFAVNRLRVFQTAEVEPVRRGKWLDVQETDLYVPDHKFTVTKTTETCSECKVRIGFIGAKLYLFDGYCPNCGARMDGGADSG